MILKDEDLILRPSNSQDPELLTILEDPEICENLSETRIRPEKMPSEIVYKVQYQGKTVGEASLKGIKWFNRKASLSVYLSKEAQGKGLGKRAVKALMRYAFQVMNLVRLEGEVLEFNTRSRQMLEKLGFILEGKMRKGKFTRGKYWDILLFGILREEFESANL